jgi:hypothetical protein
MYGYGRINYRFPDFIFYHFLLPNTLMPAFRVTAEMAVKIIKKWDL